MNATFEGAYQGRRVTIASEGSCVRLTATQGTLVAGMLLDTDTALALAAAIEQAAKKAGR